MRIISLLLTLVIAVAAVNVPGVSSAAIQEKEAVEAQAAATGAAKHPLDVWLAECTAKDESTAGQIACLTEAYKKWDAELNRVYQELMKKLPEAARAALKSSQLAWIKHRNEELNFLTALYEIPDGTMYGLMKTADQVDFVRKRALELASYIDVLDNQ